MPLQPANKEQCCVLYGNVLQWQYLLNVFVHNIHGRGGCYWRLQVTKRCQKKQSPWTYDPLHV